MDRPLQRRPAGVRAQRHTAAEEREEQADSDLHLHCAASVVCASSRPPEKLFSWLRPLYRMFSWDLDILHNP